MKYEDIVFPRLLYGDLKTTREAWRKVARRAWKSGEWDGLFAREGMVCLSDLPADIVLERGFFGTGVRRREHLWRLYWASKSICLAYRGPKTDDSVQRAAHLVLSGMDHLWFTVGMLCAETGDLYFPNGPDGRFRSYFLGLAKQFVRWLPELLTLRPLYSGESFVSSEWQRVRFTPNWWAGEIVRYIVFSGYNIPQFADEQFNWVTHVEQRYSGDVVEWLVDLGILRAHGGRFALQPGEKKGTF